MLEISQLHTGYDSSEVLFGIDLKIAEREVASLIGRNGMGKSTTVKTLMGMLPARGGSITFDGEPISDLAPHAIARAGIGLVPEGRRVFGSLSVEENLVATSRDRAEGGGVNWTLQRVYALFPRLGQRRAQYARTLSGGEQQMLAIGRALLINPRLLILDEATEGLAPLIRLEIWNCLRLLKQEGLTILVIDKNLKKMAKVVDRHHMIEKGRIVWQGSPAELEASPEIAQRYLGV
ncbi:MAG: ABC transporter ATP-binding protein [Candidatus Protistobacter heckmanni]|nr:ABC transporter ATP-binding protein [Candidatus Protistobacter heckmanni]